MKFLKSMFGKEAEKKPPTWDIKSPAERPAPRVRHEDTAVLDEPAAKPKKEPNPFLDDPMLDTLSFEKDDIVVDNPYQTHSWTLDPDSDTRKLKTITIGEQTDKKSGPEFNPYDTGKMRRSWKK